MSWLVGPLSEIADVISGFAFKSEWFGNGADKIVRIGDLQDGEINLEEAKSFNSNLNKVSNQFRILEGDVLMALSGATTGKTAVAKKKDEGSYLNQRVAIIRGKNSTNSAYVKYVLRSGVINKLLLTAGGAAQPNLSPKNLNSFIVPLPPLKEQKRIAAILDKADAIRRKRQQTIKLADDFLRSVFLEIFGDPVTNPHKFEVGRIGDLLERVNYGTSAKAGKEGEYPILRMNNITYGGDLDFSDLKYIDLSYSDKKKYMVDDGDILFNRTNSKELVGKTAVFRGKEQYVFAGYLVRSKTNSKAVPEYISGYLNSRYGKLVLENMCKSIVGMANINAKEMQKIQILVPPIEIQKEYQKTVFAVTKRIDIYNDSKDNLDKLFYSLYQDAFKGELN